MDRKREAANKHHISRTSRKKKAPVVDSRKSLTLSSDAPTALVSNKAKSGEDKALINQALHEHFLFSSLSQENREVLMRQMKLFSVGGKEIIFSQGQPGNNFFVVAEGVLQVIVNHNCVKELVRGDSFGELALLNDAPRSATIRTMQRTVMWGLDRQTFRSALESVNAQNHRETKAYVKNEPAFQVLSTSQKDALISSLSTLVFKPNQRIINEGDPGDLVYLIVDGIVVCSKEGREIRRMYPGDFFGEQAILYNTPRTASVYAIDNTKCLAIGKERLKKVLGPQIHKILYRNSLRIAFGKSPVLSSLNSDQKEDIIERFEMNIYKQGEEVIQAGTPKGQFLWVIVNGKVGTKFESFSCIGDEEIMKTTSSLYSHSYEANSEVAIVAVISRKAFLKNLIFEDRSAVNQVLSILKRDSFFFGLPDAKLKQMFQSMQTVIFEDQDVIYEEGLPVRCFYIVNDGRVLERKEGEALRSVSKLEYFGEKSLITDRPAESSMVAEGPCSLWAIGKDKFFSILDQNLQQQLRGRLETHDLLLELPELTPVKLLGKGMFGNVFLVIHKESSNLYALKTVDRRKIDSFEMQQSLLMERRILFQLDHPLILKLLKTFKDEKRLYFLLEYVKGLDLFDVLRHLGLVSEKDSRFYTACLLVILEHLHENQIMYRDLKPENIMVDSEGYPKLIDFGTAKIVDNRTYTIVGTPHYMAPEVIVGKGYTVHADYWSLGVMLYEFLCGSLPFGDDEEDPYVIYELVLERDLTYNHFIKDQSKAKSLIERLLSQTPEMRVGEGVDTLKAHPWFNGFDWEGIFKRTLNTPYRPQPHDESSEVSQALKRMQNVRDVVFAEELMDDVPECNSFIPTDLDWDEDF